jgi:hypothetical protein
MHSNLLSILLARFTGGRPGDRSADNHINSRTGHRFQQTVHESRHQYYDHEAEKGQPWSVFIHESTLVRGKNHTTRLKFASHSSVTRSQIASVEMKLSEIHACVLRATLKMIRLRFIGVRSCDFVRFGCA